MKKLKIILIIALVCVSAKSQDDKTYNSSPTEFEEVSNPPSNIDNSYLTPMVNHSKYNSWDPNRVVKSYDKKGTNKRYIKNKRTGIKIIRDIVPLNFGKKCINFLNGISPKHPIISGDSLDSGYSRIYSVDNDDSSKVYGYIEFGPKRVDRFGFDLSTNYPISKLVKDEDSISMFLSTYWDTLLLNKKVIDAKDFNNYSYIGENFDNANGTHRLWYLRSDNNMDGYRIILPPFESDTLIRWGGTSNGLTNKLFEFDEDYLYTMIGFRDYLKVNKDSIIFDDNLSLSEVEWATNKAILGRFDKYNLSLDNYAKLSFSEMMIHIYDIELDNNGSIYTTLQIEDSLIIYSSNGKIDTLIDHNKSIFPDGDGDQLIIKFNSNFELEWVRQIYCGFETGERDCKPEDFTIDDYDNLYISYDADGDFSLDSTGSTITDTFNYRGIGIIKYNSSGDLIGVWGSPDNNRTSSTIDYVGERLIGVCGYSSTTGMLLGNETVSISDDAILTYSLRTDMKDLVILDTHKLEVEVGFDGYPYIRDNYINSKGDVSILWNNNNSPEYSIAYDVVMKKELHEPWNTDTIGGHVKYAKLAGIPGLKKYDTVPEIHISHEGSDETGDGSYNNPYKTAKGAWLGGNVNKENTLVVLDSGTWYYKDLKPLLDQLYKFELRGTLYETEYELANVTQDPNIPHRYHTDSDLDTIPADSCMLKMNENNMFVIHEENDSTFIASDYVSFASSNTLYGFGTRLILTENVVEYGDFTMSKLFIIDTSSTTDGERNRFDVSQGGFAKFNMCYMNAGIYTHKFRNLVELFYCKTNFTAESNGHGPFATNRPTQFNFLYSMCVIENNGFNGEGIDIWGSAAIGGSMWIGNGTGVKTSRLSKVNMSGNSYFDVDVPIQIEDPEDNFLYSYDNFEVYLGRKVDYFIKDDVQPQDVRGIRYVEFPSGFIKTPDSVTVSVSNSPYDGHHYLDYNYYFTTDGVIDTTVFGGYAEFNDAGFNKAVADTFSVYDALEGTYMNITDGPGSYDLQFKSADDEYLSLISGGIVANSISANTSDNVSFWDPINMNDRDVENVNKVSGDTADFETYLNLPNQDSVYVNVNGDTVTGLVVFQEETEHVHVSADTLEGGVLYANNAHIDKGQASTVTVPGNYSGFVEVDVNGDVTINFDPLPDVGEVSNWTVLLKGDASARTVTVQEEGFEMNCCKWVDGTELTQVAAGDTVAVSASLSSEGVLIIHDAKRGE